MSSIFLSHNTKDKSFAKRLAHDLQDEGVQVWIDEAEMLVGDSLIRKLDQAIQDMEYLGVILSPDSVNSEWVQKEVEIALVHEIQGKRVKVLPLLYKQCEIPGFLITKVWVDFTQSHNYDKALGDLLRRLVPENTEKVVQPEKDGFGFNILNWNIGGRRFLEIKTSEERGLFRQELNMALQKIINRYDPDIVTLQEIVRFQTPQDKIIQDVITPCEGYTYYPVPLLDSSYFSSRAKWRKILYGSDWHPDMYFAQGNAFLIKNDIPVFDIWDLSKPTVRLPIEKPQLKLQKVQNILLNPGLYLGDRNTEPRSAIVTHLIYNPKSESDGHIEKYKPLDIFVVNLQLTTLDAEREGIPELDSRVTAIRRSQLEIIFNNIISRYNSWRQSGYPIRGFPRQPEDHETFDRFTPLWVLAGAFNFTEDSEEYRFVKNMNFIDMIPDKGNGTKASVIGVLPTLTLDYIFAGPRIIATDQFIQNDRTFLKNSINYNVNVSDHFPMFVRIPLGLY